MEGVFSKLRAADAPEWWSVRLPHRAVPGTVPTTRTLATGRTNEGMADVCSILSGAIRAYQREEKLGEVIATQAVEMRGCVARPN
jgi:hypothetical protein